MIDVVVRGHVRLLSMDVPYSLLIDLLSWRNTIQDVVGIVNEADTDTILLIRYVRDS